MVEHCYLAAKSWNQLCTRSYKNFVTIVSYNRVQYIAESQRNRAGESNDGGRDDKMIQGTQRVGAFSGQDRFNRDDSTDKEFQSGGSGGSGEAVGNNNVAHSAETLLSAREEDNTSVANGTQRLIVMEVTWWSVLLLEEMY